MLAIENGGCFANASARLKDDGEVAMKAIDNYVWHFQYVANRLKDDKEFVTKVIEKDWFYQILDSIWMCWFVGCLRLGLQVASF